MAKDSINVAWTHINVFLLLTDGFLTTILSGILITFLGGKNAPFCTGLLHVPIFMNVTPALNEDISNYVKLI